MPGGLDDLIAAVHVARTFFSDQPVALAGVLAGLFALVPRAVPRQAIATRLGAVAIVAYAALIAYYVAGEDYFDAAEPTVTAVGWLFASGQPVYPAIDAAERYAHIYGPMLYVIHGWILRALGPGIMVSKAIGGVLATVSLACTWLAIRGQAGRTQALAMTGACALVYLSFRNYTFWTRPEPLQLFCMSLGLLVAVRGRGLIGAVGLGLTAGLMCNLKFTGPVYSLPLFVLWQRRAGWRATAVAAATAAAGTVLPFVAFHEVSWTNYRTWVERSAVTGLLLPLLRQNVEWAIYLALPAIALVSGRRSATAADPGAATWILVSGTTAIAAGLIVIAAAKPGAGPYHVLPLVPVAAYLVTWALNGATNDASPRRWQRPLVAGWLTSLCIIAFTQQFQFVWIMAGRRADPTADDIRAFASSHEGTIEMGYGVSDPISLARPILVFRNGSYLLDQPAIGEHQLAGIPIPEATLNAIQSCRVSSWLIPKGEEPFTARNFYPAVRFQPLYPEKFRLAFLSNYARAGETRHFDVWQCRH